MTNRNQTLVVCGPTGVGKTDLGVYLAKKLNGELISADSRQVYVGLDLLSGKDIPHEAKKICRDGLITYVTNRIAIWGYDLVTIHESYSVGQFVSRLSPVFVNMRTRGVLPIIVGGTGLYINGLLGKIDTALIPQDKTLRSEIELLTILALQEMLKKFDTERLEGMNESDRNNPRRLVRAIEISVYLKGNKPKGKIDNPSNPYDVLRVGLTASPEFLRKRIEDRVEKRLENGVIEEVEAVLASKTAVSAQVLTMIGFEEIKGYLEGKFTLEELKGLWVQKEMQYIKRQMTWFKKDLDVHWFDVSEPNWKEKVEKLVVSWHNRS